MDKTLRSQLQPNTEMFHTTTLKYQSQNVLTLSSSAASLRSLAVQEQHLHRFQNGHSPVQKAAEHNVICGIMQKQNESTTMLAQHKSATLPQREITIFDGDPLQCTLLGLSNIVLKRGPAVVKTVFSRAIHQGGALRIHVTPQ